MDIVDKNFMIKRRLFFFWSKFCWLCRSFFFSVFLFFFFSFVFHFFSVSWFQIIYKSSGLKILRKFLIKFFISFDSILRSRRWKNFFFFCGMHLFEMVDSFSRRVLHSLSRDSSASDSDANNKKSSPKSERRVRVTNFYSVTKVTNSVTKVISIEV